MKTLIETTGPNIKKNRYENVKYKKIQRQKRKIQKLKGLKWILNETTR